MRELFENLYSYFWMVLHHRWIVLCGAITITLIGWTVVGFIPDNYEVEAKVFFDTRTILKPLLKGLAVDDNLRAQSAMIVRKTFLTRLNLTKVANEADLALGVTDPKDMELLLDKLKKNIKIRSVDISGRRRDESNVYRIIYKHTDPQVAKRVVESLLNIFVETTLGSNRKDSDKAEVFLDVQIKEYAKKLEQAEERLKLFKQENAGMMPDEGTNYFSRLNNLNSKLEDAKLQLNEKINKSEALKRQIKKLVDKSSKDSNQVLQMLPDPLGTRIENLQTKLDELLLQYTDRHPDVISTRSALKELRRQKKEQESNKSAGRISSNNSILNSKLYQDLNLMQGEVESEIAAIRARVDEYNKRTVEMNSLISAIPEVEAELKRLDRDYAIIKDTYDSLVQRRASAQISRDAEQTANESQFNVIEPPTIPLNPVSPNRFVFTTFVLLLGIAGGIGVAFIIEQIKPAFYTQKQVEETFNLPVLGSISMFWSDKELIKRRREIVAYSLISLLFLCSYIVILVNQDLYINISELIK
ncbi:MAG: XrtA system polysaccharide chain length determinant [Candidatus Scalindua sp.]